MYKAENLERLNALNENAPEPMKTFWAFDAAAMAAGALSGKQKELIAVGVALTTQCPYCIDIHARRARAAGATDAELAEVVAVAAALRAGAAITHGTHAFASAAAAAA